MKNPDFKLMELLMVHRPKWTVETMESFLGMPAVVYVVVGRSVRVPVRIDRMLKMGVAVGKKELKLSGEQQADLRTKAVKFNPDFLGVAQMGRTGLEKMFIWFIASNPGSNRYQTEEATEITEQSVRKTLRGLEAEGILEATDSFPKQKTYIVSPAAISANEARLLKLAVEKFKGDIVWREDFEAFSGVPPHSLQDALKRQEALGAMHLIGINKKSSRAQILVLSGKSNAAQVREAKQRWSESGGGD